MKIKKNRRRRQTEMVILHFVRHDMGTNSIVKLSLFFCQRVAGKGSGSAQLARARISFSVYKNRCYKREEGSRESMGPPSPQQGVGPKEHPAVLTHQIKQAQTIEVCFFKSIRRRREEGNGNKWLAGVFIL
eukprot:gnl/MRDRNA2_/MRDRNA2_150438_c0_seq1.p1 gnl/MRDRNA2_/MRDRNA2_150438_c0~~gnl/MRDRNA2_/MRDRNA2_150438_c0_seq1.p1  ORF type:complete len:131 (+),score=9.18 gnl/MRDRNA2_/MRDRNA2_150438_c0_seq1:22-414(+)